MIKKIFVNMLICVTVFLLAGCKTITPTAPANMPTNSQITSTQEIATSPLPTPTPSAVPDHSTQEGLMIGLAGKDYGALFLVKTATGDIQKLQISGDTTINIYSWSDNGCTLFVGTESARIIQVDIAGNVINEMINIEETALNGKLIQARISPDEKWAALIFGTGNHEFTSYEIQNLYTVSVTDEPFRVYELTNSGVTTAVAWKPDSSLIAYANDDEFGDKQIFISNPDGTNKSQLTHLDIPISFIRSVKWSPSGNKIAFVIVDEDAHKSYLAVTNILENDNLVYINSIIGVNEFWWASDDMLVADVLPRGADPNTIGSRTVSWYDSTTGVEIGKIDSEKLSNGVIETPGPLAPSDKIGFFLGDGFYSYDISTAQIERIFNKFTDSRYWISAPVIFNKEVCDATGNQ